MKTALDCYERGKQKESNADEYNVNSYYPKGRFTCPECGEFVHIRKSKYSNYFAHYKKSDTSAECDRRVDGVPTDSIYERIGLPIYIRRSSPSEDYELYIGFKALPKSIMEGAEKNQIKMTIDEKYNYLINRERFSTDNTVLVPIYHIPNNEKKYTILYTPKDKAGYIMKHWSNYSDGFSFEGALFTVFDQGGRKLHHGDSISTDVEYYWVRKTRELPSWLPGIKMKLQGRLKLANARWYVYKTRILSNLDDNEFNFLTAFFRDKLKLYLLEREPKYVPLWPPMIKKDDAYVVEKDNEMIYGCVISGNDEAKTYIYQGVNSIPKEVLRKEKLLLIKTDSSEFLVNIDRKYISGGARFIRSDVELKSAESMMTVNIAGEIFSVENKLIELEEVPVQIEGINNKIFVILKYSGEIQVIDNQKTEFDIQMFEMGDTLYILSRTCLRSIVRFTKSKDTTSALNESYIERKIMKYRESSKSAIPNKLRIELTNINWTNRKIQLYIKRCLQTNCIPVPLINMLEAYLNENY